MVAIYTAKKTFSAIFVWNLCRGGFSYHTDSVWRHDHFQKTLMKCDKHAKLSYGPENSPDSLSESAESAEGKALFFASSFFKLRINCWFSLSFYESKDGNYSVDKPRMRQCIRELYGEMLPLGRSGDTQTFLARMCGLNRTKNLFPPFQTKIAKKPFRAGRT